MRQEAPIGPVVGMLMIGAVCVSAALLAKRAEQHGSRMDFADKRVAEKFAAFEKNHEPALLQDALETIEAAELDTLSGCEAARRRKLSRWLLFFAALDRNIDPQWDPKEVPVIGVIPPPSHGVVYSPGVDPSMIFDPAARIQYEKALKTSTDQAAQYRVQHTLRRIDERAMSTVGRLIAEEYNHPPADWREFEELLASAPVNDVRKNRLRALMAKPKENER
jgi:hypothetical protein